jgi:hypothetical protein
MRLRTTRAALNSATIVGLLINYFAILKLMGSEFHLYVKRLYLNDSQKSDGSNKKKGFGQL